MTVAANKAFVILDGTLLHVDRIAADRPYYSGKHKRYGMNVQVIADAFGRLLWVSPALPGAVHDIKAARTHGIIEALTQAGIRTWADKGYQGTRGTIRVPYRGRWSTLPAGKRAVNSSNAKIRAVGEQANATLKSWRLRRKLRCSTARITDIVKVVLVLHLATAARGRYGRRQDKDSAAINDSKEPAHRGRRQSHLRQDRGRSVHIPHRTAGPREVGAHVSLRSSGRRRHDQPRL